MCDFYDFGLTFSPIMSKAFFLGHGLNNHVALQIILPNMDDVQNSSTKIMKIAQSALLMASGSKNLAYFQICRYETLHLNRDKDITDLIFDRNSQ